MALRLFALMDCFETSRADDELENCFPQLFDSKVNCFDLFAGSVAGWCDCVRVATFLTKLFPSESVRALPSK